jgi:hypothetical protein
VQQQAITGICHRRSGGSAPPPPRNERIVQSKTLRSGVGTRSTGTRRGSIIAKEAEGLIREDLGWIITASRVSIRIFVDHWMQLTIIRL